MFPWAYTSIHTSDFKDLNDLAFYMAKKVRTNGGENYRFGTVSGKLYLASGEVHFQLTKLIIYVNYLL